MRATDIVARLSGDEFAVLMPQTDTAGALQLGEDLRAQVAESARPAPELGRGDDQRRDHDVRRRARRSAPRRCWSPPTRRCTGPRRRAATGSRSSSDPDEPQARRRAAARRPRARIRDALTHDRLSLATQPIRSLASGGIERYELLLRMTGDDGELLPAASFIEAAERSGMVQELDRWVVGRALELLAERERDGRPGLPARQPLRRLARPTSRCSSSSSGGSTKATPTPPAAPSRSPQTARVDDYDTAGGFADRLTEFGCQVAIDDYGAGFGPFHYLKRIPFDLIKIDGAFVRDMPRNDADQLTVKAIVQIARGLGKTTIAEFVQDDATTEMLREYGVDMAQGFHLGRPGRRSTEGAGGLDRLALAA